MKNLLYALLSGFLLALAWPTYGFPILIFLAFVPLLFAEFNIRNSEIRYKKLQILGLSYLSFLIWNLITTYWLYYSTLFGAAFAILVNSLLMSLVFLLYHYVAKRSDFRSGAAFFISIWIIFENIHLGWEFSWPWLNLGNVFAVTHNWVQWYEYTGAFGGTLWILLVNIGIFKSVISYREFRQREIIWRGIIKAALFVALPIAVSYLIRNYYSEAEKTLEAVILQPNIDPYKEKYNVTDTRIGEHLLKLSREKITDNTALVVAPETVFASGTVLNKFPESEAAFYSKQILEQSPNLNFLSGISMYERFNDPERVAKQSNQLGPMDWYNDYNSAFLMNQQSPPQLYHKSKLVVGVENFPYQSILKPILGDVMIDLGGTVAMKTTQEERAVFELNNGYSTAPIICYESVYGEYVTCYVRNGADFLTIITNDAWWSDTQGHKQHLNYAKLRAIETRRSIVRSANTGISAFINEKGDILETLGYTEVGSIRGEVTLNTEETFYVRHGDYIARVSKFLAAFLFLFAVVKYERRKRR
ncbi:apolipoprotein N-acyltransferase [Antarcticibacterium sp. 1MA-6-2]|uniref:apolipoprotein N-acyltransferase n=1 Tax=Antarcticibacterium sp. 1MA-6-2 TaxID=2908210 RepID=UPI001F163798|nr:apolipoprotein N-acyltransferase [Antarcticibacterium sp. 1MA-6-2]UJH92489.1 apolipoprotein N-acyltransferase [Antarcticibacterium sp. 1MA-6-2]